MYLLYYGDLSAEFVYSYKVQECLLKVATYTLARIYIYIMFTPVVYLHILYAFIGGGLPTKKSVEYVLPAALEAQGPTITLQKNRKKN